MAETNPSSVDGKAPLILLAVFASIFILDWAQAVFIPLVLGLLVSYALAPVVDRLEKLRIPRGLSAAVLLLAFVGGVGATAFSLRDEAVSLVEQMPEAVQKMQESVRREFAGQGKTIEKMEAAAQELERVAAEATSAKAAPGVTRVQVERPKLNFREYLLTNAIVAASVIGLSVIVLFLAYFLLASGDAVPAEMGPAVGSDAQPEEDHGAGARRDQRPDSAVSRRAATDQRHGRRRQRARVLGDWPRERSGLGRGCGCAQPRAVCGRHRHPAGTALVAFLQFGTVGMALAVGSITLVVNSLEGYWLMPWLSSRASRMNAVVVFGGLLFWGWLWGGWGLVLGLPIMMVIKAICDHVEDFKPIGEFMAE